MTTTVTSTKIQPAVTMDKLHVDSLTFQQERVTTPKRVIGMSGVLYGTDANGESVFDKETFGVNDLDFDTTAITAFVTAGKGTPEDFIALYNAAKLQIDAEIVAGTLTDAMLMAYFEAALGRIFELHGKIDVAGVV